MRSVNAHKNKLVTPMDWKRSVPKEIMNGWVRDKLTPEEAKLVDDLKLDAKLIHNVLDAIGILFVEVGRIVL
jgi:hypothetical protein